jgi:MFS family permease
LVYDVTSNEYSLMGLVKSYHGLLIARFFLGVAESGFFPGATYLLTLWYLRFEVQRRMAVFYVAASLSGAFSGLLAFAIEKMKGIRGLDGWSWIFILEGLVPIFCSFFIWWLLPDSPETARFLKKHEKEFLINRLALETGSGTGRVTNADKIKWKHVKAALSEWKIWASVVMFWGNTIGVYGYAQGPEFVSDKLTLYQASLPRCLRSSNNLGMTMPTPS